MIGGRLLGVRGPAQGIFKQGLMTPPGVAVAATVTPTIIALTPSSTTGGFPISNARDGDVNTFFASSGSDNFVLTIQLSSAAKLRYISETLRPTVPYYGMGEFTAEYSDDGSTWTPCSDGTKTFSGYAGGTYTQGQVCTATLADNGAHTYWRLKVTKTIDTTPMPIYASFSEVAFATDAAGTQLLVGP